MVDPTSPTSRRFSEKEVAKIIKRASELQEEEAPAESTNGMSLVELEQVAREAGLDPALVRRAATDLDTRVTDQKPSPFVGAPTRLRLERTIDGELPADEFEPMVLEMQRIVGQVGSASTIGRTLQWTAYGVDRRRVSTRTVQVIITPRNGRTTIRIEEPLTQLAGGLFGGLMGGMGGGLSGAAVGVGMGAFHSGSVTVGLIAALVSGSYLLARTIFGRMAQRRGEELQELMSRLVEHVSATAVAPQTLGRPAERGSLERGEPT
ncbi:MAG TPA: hypothetical protein VGP25_15745 [Gemmatimonadaceae bacterium]|jgi:hypothetical protein|nr:hypothetical protein [Gemmatimonadaceae bacterium]